MIKHYLKSRTLWINAIVFALAAAKHLYWDKEGFLQFDEMTGVMLLTWINGVLRIVTTKAIAWTVDGE